MSRVEVPERAAPRGSIADLVARLARWGRLAPDGLARVEYLSETARSQVIERLRSAFVELGIPFYEIPLPVQAPAERVVRELVERFRTLEPGGVSLTGFETAFLEAVHLPDSLRVLNFYRETLALHSLCQIWWMAPSFVDTFIHAAPDLDSWFIVRLTLTELGAPSADLPQAGQELPLLGNPPAARRSAELLTERFRYALANEASQPQLLSLVNAATRALRETGLEEEALQLENKLVGEMQELRSVIPLGVDR